MSQEKRGSCSGALPSGGKLFPCKVSDSGRYFLWLHPFRYYESPFYFRRPTPTYNEYAREHMPLAPAYPEMDQEGYVHKQHGNIIIPDYRVYQPERVRKLMPDDVLAKHMTRMEMEGLKDPWLRNDLWK